MSGYSEATVWWIIAAMGIGTFGLRFCFLGIVGDRPLPPWLLRHLRYTAVAVMPGLVAPLVIWPEATGGALDAPRMAAAAVTLAVGVVTRNLIASIIAGAGTLYGVMWLI